MKQGISKANEFGDFQTPQELCRSVCLFLKDRGVTPQILIEPTCGEGTFILEALKTFPKIEKIFGIELNKKYAETSKERVSSFIKENGIETKYEIINKNIFEFDFRKMDFRSKQILILGNPPWVTNSNLDGKNLPLKSNFKNHRGIDALTGKSNFDISEVILIKLINEFQGTAAKLALLCKTQVARKLLEFLPSTGLKVSKVTSSLFDAKKEFGVSCEACLLTADLDTNKQEDFCLVNTLANGNEETHSFGFVNGHFTSNMDLYKRFGQIDGKSQLIWRSGLKHDCSCLFELHESEKGKLVDQKGDIQYLERDRIFPFVKSSDIQVPFIESTKRVVIVTQDKPKQDTAFLKKYPRLWEYLSKNSETIAKRKSSIYNKSPLFSIFGVGPYSFLPYKIAISGLYKKAIFCLLSPIDGKPIIPDDTCYFLSFNDKKIALITLGLLSSSIVQNFLKAVTFNDAKRPYTKEVLMRINLISVLERTSLLDLHNTLNALGVQDIEAISKDDYAQFGKILRGRTNQAKLAIKPGHQRSTISNHKLPFYRPVVPLLAFSDP